MLHDLDQVCGDVLHMDPARRDRAGNRMHNPATWSPNIELAREAWDAHLDACLMLGPGIDLGQFEVPQHVNWRSVHATARLLIQLLGQVPLQPLTALELPYNCTLAASDQAIQVSPQGGPAPRVGSFCTYRTPL